MVTILGKNRVGRCLTFVCLVALMSVLSACGGKQSKGTSAHNSDDAEKPEDEQELEEKNSKNKKQNNTKLNTLSNKVATSSSASINPGTIIGGLPPLPQPQPQPQPVATFAVVYDGNGNDAGMAPSDATRYPSGAMVTLKANTGALSKSGHSFAGWNTAADGSGTTYKAESGSFAMGGADVKLYARWLAGVLCGEANDSCYNNKAALAAGSAVTFTGKALVLMNGIWSEKDGTRVLSPNGLDEWAFALTPDGRKFSTNHLKRSDIAGRVCPKNVFMPGNLVATGRCLYYDAGNPAQRLDAPSGDSVTEQMTAGSIRLGVWNTNAGGNGTAASWYEGNIQTCAAKGMRLPTLYETTANPAGNPIDALPTFSPGEGVPSVGNAYTWTATALYSSYSAASYMLWSGTSSGYQSLTTISSIRCVAG